MFTVLNFTTKRNEAIIQRLQSSLFIDSAEEFTTFDNQECDSAELNLATSLVSFSLPHTRIGIE